MVRPLNVNSVTPGRGLQGKRPPIDGRLKGRSDAGRERYLRAMSIPEVEVAEAARLVEGGAWLLDVREPAEWDAGHSPLAVWIPLGELGARLDEVPSDRTVAVVCRSGGRSAAATEALRGTGIDAVNVAGGMKSWAVEGLPVVAADGLPGVVT